MFWAWFPLGMTTNITKHITIEQQKAIQRNGAAFDTIDVRTFKHCERLRLGPVPLQCRSTFIENLKLFLILGNSCLLAALHCCDFSHHSKRGPLSKYEELPTSADPPATPRSGRVANGVQCVSCAIGIRSLITTD